MPAWDSRPWSPGTSVLFLSLCTFVSLVCTTSSFMCLDSVLCSDNGLPQLYKVLAFLLFSERGWNLLFHFDGSLILSLLFHPISPRPPETSASLLFRSQEGCHHHSLLALRSGQLFICQDLWFGLLMPSWVLLFTLTKCCISSFSFTWLTSTSHGPLNSEKTFLSLGQGCS